MVRSIAHVAVIQRLTMQATLRQSSYAEAKMPKYVGRGWGPNASVSAQTHENRRRHDPILRSALKAQIEKALITLLIARLWNADL